MGIRLAVNEKENPQVVEKFVEIMLNLGSGQYTESIVYMMMNHPNTSEILAKKIMGGQVNIRSENEPNDEPVIPPNQSRL